MHLTKLFTIKCRKQLVEIASQILYIPEFYETFCTNFAQLKLSFVKFRILKNREGKKKMAWPTLKQRYATDNNYSSRRKICLLKCFPHFRQLRPIPYRRIQERVMQEGGMQEEGCRKGGMQEGGMQERSDA